MADIERSGMVFSQASYGASLGCVMGVYPLLAGETMWYLLVAGKSWGAMYAAGMAPLK
jgi:hypothetical protein